jgi:hypothetical protein
MSCLIALLLSQVSADPLSGGAGWVGAGLLGAVLAWLCLLHLPGKDKQIERLIEAKDKAVDGAVRAFFEEGSRRREIYEAALDRVCKEFRDEITAEREACEARFAALLQRVKG